MNLPIGKPFRCSFLERATYCLLYCFIFFTMTKFIYSQLLGLYLDIGCTIFSRHRMNWFYVHNFCKYLETDCCKNRVYKDTLFDQFVKLIIISPDEDNFLVTYHEQHGNGEQFYDEYRNFRKDSVHY